MELTKKHKLLMIFLSTKNPIMKELVSIHINGRPVASVDKSDVNEITRISYQTQLNWSNGLPIQEQRAQRVFQYTLEYLEEMAEAQRGTARFNANQYMRLRTAIEQYAAFYERNEDEVVDVGPIIGLSAADCQQIIDEVIYDSWPLLRAVYSPAPMSPDVVKEEFDRLEGLYLVTLRRGEDMWLEAPLQVRYLQPLGSGRFIRCKLNFPIIRNPPPERDPNDPPLPTFWEYDGLLVTRSLRLWWTFEKRQVDRNDLFHFITDRQGNGSEEHPQYAGEYLTTGQDKLQSVVSGPIMVEKLFSDAQDRQQRRYRDAMHSLARVLTAPDDIARAAAKWRKLTQRQK